MFFLSAAIESMHCKALSVLFWLSASANWRAMASEEGGGNDAHVLMGNDAHVLMGNDAHVLMGNVLMGNDAHVLMGNDAHVLMGNVLMGNDAHVLMGNDAHVLMGNVRTQQMDASEHTTNGCK